MKNYNINIEMPVLVRFNVDANSIEEALKKIYEDREYNDCDIADGFYIHKVNTDYYSKIAIVEDENNKCIKYKIDSDNYTKIN